MPPKKTTKAAKVGTESTKGKKTITSFFPTQPAAKTAGAKRSKAEEEESDSSVAKRSASSSDHGDGELSLEQRQSMARNKLDAEVKQLVKKLGVECLEPSWVDALYLEFKKAYFTELWSFVEKERETISMTIYPPAKDVFSWMGLCPITEVKVVILGQDPYHGLGQAHGLCFSVPIGIPAPPSLVNMYKELVKDIDNFEMPNHGFLIGWAKQGVLLLNACLTVRAHKANSHQGKGWEKLTDAVIKWINDNLENVVFLLWGASAQKKGSVISQKRHHVLKTVHPSPLSAHRGFFGCKHFSQANHLLQESGKKPIDWAYLPQSLE